MSIYERLREERNDAKRENKARKKATKGAPGYNAIVTRSNPTIGAKYRARFLERIYERTYLDG